MLERMVLFMKIITTAPAGKIGRLIVREAVNRADRLQLIGTIGPKGRSYIGQDAGTAAMSSPVGAICYDDIEEIIEMADGVVDFSTTENSMAILQSCLRHKKALMLGTTGFTDEQQADILRAGEMIPLLYTHNTSKAMNLVFELSKIVAKEFAEEADIEIIEMHDNKKPDAPSGTAKMLGGFVAEVLGKDINTISDYGHAGLREPGHIGFHSVRAGDISSEHTIMFCMEGERIELTHRAYNQLSCARGALDGIQFLEGKEPGLYSFAQVLGF